MQRSVFKEKSQKGYNIIFFSPLPLSFTFNLFISFYWLLYVRILRFKQEYFIQMMKRGNFNVVVYTFCLFVKIEQQSALKTSLTK